MQTAEFIEILLDLQPSRYDSKRYYAMQWLLSTHIKLQALVCTYKVKVVTQSWNSEWFGIMKKSFGILKAYNSISFD